MRRPEAAALFRQLQKTPTTPRSVRARSLPRRCGATRGAGHEGGIRFENGESLRVPVNGPKGEPRSLEQAKAAGGDVRPIASPLEAAQIARDNPARKVVFLAAGFETTTAPALARTSGSTRTPRSSRMSSAAGVTGPFVPSQIIRGVPRPRRTSGGPAPHVTAGG